MTGDRAMDLVYYGILLLLPLSALAARRIPIGRTVKMGLVWIAIFCVGFLLIAQRDRFLALWPSTRPQGGTVRIPIASDGHFWANVRINGIERRMLIDSGATTTALSVATARAAGLDLAQSPFPAILETANGPVTADHSTIRQLSIGTIVLNDVGAVVSPSFGDQDVIGMNVLKRIGRWRAEKGTLILNPEN
ncbi:TIGR02281 family clan AA aspartic protease [Sphingomonas sp.]|uniref:retropepsin-like aspartic protease family protein n=1 Tax=Sphingomonas sp. TaxID=28214 RepID=UPI0031DF24C6